MKSKRELLRPRLLECIDRLRKFVELDAPAVIVGMSAWSVMKVTLATYGSDAWKCLIDDICEAELHDRAICRSDGCTAYVDRPDV